MKEEPKQELPKLGTKEFNDLASVYFGGKPKQETLEEAAEKFYPPKTTDLICSPKLVRDAFKDGAEWQAERMYSEEDLKQAFKSGRMVKNYKAEWEETYSDEMTSCKYEDFKQWFEQFEKK